MGTSKEQAKGFSFFHFKKQNIAIDTKRKLLQPKTRDDSQKKSQKTWITYEPKYKMP